MDRVIKFPLENGGTVLIETEGFSSSSGMGYAGRSSEIADSAVQTLEVALEPIRSTAEAILQRLTSLSERPHDIEVEFALKVSAESGVIIAKGTIEANFVVRLKWTQDKSAK